MKKILLSLLLSFTVPVLWAQNGYWERAKGPYGGGAGAVITKTSNGQLYATLGHLHPYRSGDGGQNWERLPPLSGVFPDSLTKYLKIGNAGAFFLKLLDLDNPQHPIWYKSTDEGQTWEDLDDDITEIEETGNGTLLCQKNFGNIWRSTDGGQSWVQKLSIEAGQGYTDITPFGDILVYEYPKIYRSTDDGDTWSSQQTGDSYQYITPTGLILTVKNDTLYRSTDGGASFVSTMLGGLYSPTFTALNSGRLLLQIPDIGPGLDKAHDLLYSDDDGFSWQVLATAQQGAGGNLTRISPLSDGTIFKQYLDALLRSIDGGLTWQFSGVGIDMVPVEEMKFVSDSVAFALTRIGLWKTENAGENWSLLTQNLVYNTFNETNFDISPSGGVAVFQNHRLLWSSDYGETFTDKTPTDSLPASFQYVFINPFDNSLFVNSIAGINKSTNFGQTWTLASVGNLAHSMAFHPSGRIIANCKTEILASDNAGDTWSPVPNPTGWNNPDWPLDWDNSGSIAVVAPNGNLYLSRRGGLLWHSEDAGQTWTKLPFGFDGGGNYGFEALAIASNGHLYISGGYQTIFLSIDEGNNWQTLPESFPNQYLLHIAISPDQRILVGQWDLDETWGVGPQLYQSSFPVTQGAYIEGYVKTDADGNCSTPDAQIPLQGRIISASGDDFSYFTQTNPEGHFALFVDTGSYQVTVQNPSAIWWSYCQDTILAEVPELFITDTADFAAIPISFCPLMTVDVAIPVLRRCFNNTVYVAYCNQGTELADSAWIDIQLDPYLSFVGSAQPNEVLANDSIRFFLGAVPSGVCGQFQLTVYVNCDSTVLGQTHCMTAHGFPDTLCTTVPNWSGANIEAAVICQDTTLQIKVKNTGSANSDILNYIIIEDDVVLLTGQKEYTIDEDLVLNFPANGHTWRVESEQEPGHPFSSLALAFAEGCGGNASLGYINQFPVNGIRPNWHRVCVENTGSFDPNDKQGFPLGVGPDHNIRPGQTIDYLIRFQNTGTDTAFKVVIRDTFSTFLNPNSFRPGASSHPYTWDLSGQGVIAFRFNNILLPDSNVNELASHGFVQFSIDPYPYISLGSVIENSAAIYFDFNAAVFTNTTWHTIEKSPLPTALLPEPKQVPGGLETWPNPFKERTFIHLNHKAAGAMFLNVFDSKGNLVAHQTAFGLDIELSASQLPSGVYWAEVRDMSGRLLGNSKLIKE